MNLSFPAQASRRAVEYLSLFKRSGSYSSSATAFNTYNVGAAAAAPKATRPPSRLGAPAPRRPATTEGRPRGPSPRSSPKAAEHRPAAPATASPAASLAKSDGDTRSVAWLGSESDGSPKRGALPDIAHPAKPPPAAKDRT